MNTKFNFAPAQGKPIAYVRPVALLDLPVELQEKVRAEGLESLYAVHDADGERLALVKDRGLAFMLARQNHMAPVSVH